MINKVLRFPERIPCDKRLHFMIGAVFTALLMLVTMSYFVLIGSVVALAWGIEVYQKLTKSGTYDNVDAIFVVIGGVTVLIPYFKGLL